MSKSRSAAKIPPGIKIIACTAYTNVVADLTDSNPNGLVIGYPYNHGSPNQQWTFSPLKIPQNNKIFTTAKGGATAYATSANPSVGDVVYASPAGTVYFVETTDAGNYTISVKSGSDSEFLFWTLASDTPGTKITLQPANGSATQIWSVNPPS